MTAGGVVAEAVVRPGDTLLIAVSDAGQALDRFEALQDRLPGVQIVFLNGVVDMLVYRPDS